ncbi:DUF4390 domain-containing protein [Limnohabitans sp.]|uniref:DUF4390 domain-containing protein n=1 Tax=Limnohabitans sp. TaxID=1907725 RepID=UPI002B0036DC|nr:DUF4390 domain-containing protein [Limnohabitans sp.]
MGFITHCWKSAKVEPRRWGGWVLGAWLLLASAAWAQNSVAELTELRPERRDAALYLTAQLKLELAPAVEDALIKGLAVHFVAEAEVMRDRWYWSDRKVGTASRYYRLAFQPLTRRWRLNVSNEPISSAGLAGSISQSFENLPDALAVIRRQSGWRIAEMTDVTPDTRQYINYRFWLDMSQLPRPFQIAAGNQTEWSLNVARQIRLTADMVR